MLRACSISRNLAQEFYFADIWKVCRMINTRHKWIQCHWNDLLPWEKLFPKNVRSIRYFIDKSQVSLVRKRLISRGCTKSCMYENALKFSKCWQQSYVGAQKTWCKMHSGNFLADVNKKIKLCNYNQSLGHKIQSSTEYADVWKCSGKSVSRI